MLNFGLTSGLARKPQGMTMRFHRPAKFSAAATALAASLALASPALAHDGHAARGIPAARPGYDHPGYAHPDYDRAAYERGYENARADWLTVCRHDQARYSHRRDGTGGAVVGGLLGGLLGNRIAGHGDRAVGTVIGAVGGAVAGAAIDRAGDRSGGDAAAHDYCEAYLNAYSQPAYAQAGYGYGQPMMVPMMAQAPLAQQEPCTETVETEEWLPEPARPQRNIRRIPPRRLPDKRIRSR